MITGGPLVVGVYIAIQYSHVKLGLCFPFLCPTIVQELTSDAFTIIDPTHEIACYRM